MKNFRAGAWAVLLLVGLASTAAAQPGSFKGYKDATVKTGSVPEILGLSKPTDDTTAADNSQQSTSWLGNLFGTSKPDAKKAADPPAKTPTPPKPEKAATQPKPDKAATQPKSDKAGPQVDRSPDPEREKKALWRRLDACDRLKKIAQETDNQALEQEAQRLDDMAWKAFTSHAGRVGGDSDVAEKDLRSGGAPSPAAGRTASVTEGKQ